MIKVFITLKNNRQYTAYLDSLDQLDEIKQTDKFITFYAEKDKTREYAIKTDEILLLDYKELDEK